MSDSNLAVDLREVTKIYKGRIRALDGIEMHVQRGEIFGLLGPNGAGKSTLVKIIMSVTRPTQAKGLVLGQPVGSKASLMRVGYLPEHHRFPRYLTGRQTLEFFAALSNVDQPTRKKRAAELLETVGMSAWADKKVSTYSKGMMQRVGVAQALVNDPELVILDEPTDGVDPVGRREIRDVLVRLKSQGRTVFINSHLLQELEMISDRVAILVAGQVVRQGTIDELTRESQCFTVEIEAGDDPAAKLKAALAGRAAATWTGRTGEGGVAAFAATLADGLAVEIQGPCVRVQTRQAADVQAVIDALRGAGLVIRRIQPVRQSLEDLFMQTVGGVEGGHQAGAAIAKKGGYQAVIMRQTGAILVDAYRELQAKKMFWVVLILNALVIGLFAILGVNERSLTVLWYEVGDARRFGMEPTFLYKYAYSSFVVGFWFTWLATLLALISVAGVFPDFMSSGGVDLFLAKPIGRLRLFLTKFLAGLLFVAFQVALFTGMSYFVLGIRAGIWEAGLFWAIPIVLVFFSYLFGVCVLMGTLTRSTIAALLLTLLAWAGFWLVDYIDRQVSLVPTIVQMQQDTLNRQLESNALQIEQETKSPGADSAANLASLQSQRTILQKRRDTAITPQGVETAQRVLYWIKSVVPKTHDTIALLDRVLFKDSDLQSLSKQDTDQTQAAPAPPMRGGRGRGPNMTVELQNDRKRSLGWIVGTSLIFEAVCVVLAAWHFCTRDF